MNIDPHLPIDKTAAFVVSRSNEQGSDFKVGAKITSMSPLPTTQFVGPKKHNLTGMRCGRFTVVGCALFKPKNWRTSTNTTRWVARCACGRYQIFTTRGIKRNIENEKFACVECERNLNKYKHDNLQT